MVIAGQIIDDLRKAQKVQKVYTLYENTKDPEREAAFQALIRLGYYVDRAGVLWLKDQVPEWVMKGEPVHGH